LSSSPLDRIATLIPNRRYQLLLSLAYQFCMGREWGDDFDRKVASDDE
jgi:hypothetical protein